MATKRSLVKFTSDFFQAVPRSGLVSLTLWRNSIGDAGAKAFASAVEQRARLHLSGAPSYRRRITEDVLRRPRHGPLLFSFHSGIVGRHPGLQDVECLRLVARRLPTLLEQRSVVLFAAASRANAIHLDRWLDPPARAGW